MSQASAADLSAVIRFTKGPDKGQVFELREELVHLGRGAENHFRLADDALEEHELSIVLRNGRYAIYASRDQTVAVDGNLLPAEKWVWLPEQAEVALASSTLFQFEVRTTGPSAKLISPPNKSMKLDHPTAAGGSQVKSMPVPKGRGARKVVSESQRRSSAEPPVKRTKAVARFITDSVGDPLVKLGEDGNFPELSLEEVAGEQRKKKGPDTRKAEGNSLLLYIALAFSVISSTLMLVFDFDLGGGSRVNKSEARVEIRRFYGQERDSLKEYQLLLREAAIAHSRGDSRTERDSYRAVMRMLTSEDNQGFIRLTESKESDERLRELLATLLAN